MNYPRHLDWVLCEPVVARPVLSVARKQRAVGQIRRLCAFSYHLVAEQIGGIEPRLYNYQAHS